MLGPRRSDLRKSMARSLPLRPGLGRRPDGAASCYCLDYVWTLNLDAFLAQNSGRSLDIEISEDWTEFGRVWHNSREHKTRGAGLVQT